MHSSLPYRREELHTLGRIFFLYNIFCVQFLWEEKLGFSSNRWVKKIDLTNHKKLSKSSGE